MTADLHPDRSGKKPTRKQIKNLPGGGGVKEA
jgi:hypothetical protein